MVKISFTGFLVILFAIATVISLIMMLVSMIRFQIKEGSEIHLAIQFWRNYLIVSLFFLLICATIYILVHGYISFTL